MLRISQPRGLHGFAFARCPSAQKFLCAVLFFLGPVSAALGLASDTPTSRVRRFRRGPRLRSTRRQIHILWSTPPAQTSTQRKEAYVNPPAIQMRGIVISMHGRTEAHRVKYALSSLRSSRL